MEIEKSARHKTEKQIFVLQQELEHVNESVARLQAEIQKEQMIRQKLETNLNVYSNKEEQRWRTLCDSVNKLLAKDSERAEPTCVHMIFLHKMKSRKISKLKICMISCWLRRRKFFICNLIIRQVGNFKSEEPPKQDSVQMKKEKAFFGVIFSLLDHHPIETSIKMDISVMCNESRRKHPLLQDNYWKM